MDKRILAFCLVVTLVFALLVPIEAKADPLPVSCPVYVYNPVVVGDSFSDGEHAGAPEARSYRDYTLLYTFRWSASVNGFVDGYTDVSLPLRFDMSFDSSALGKTLYYQVLETSVSVPSAYVLVTGGEDGSFSLSPSSSSASASPVLTISVVDAPMPTGFVNFYATVTVKVRVGWSFVDSGALDWRNFRLYASAPVVRSNQMYKRSDSRQSSLLKSVSDGIVSAVNSMSSALQNSISDWGTAINNTLGNFKTSVDTAFTSLQNSVVTWGTNIRDSVVTWGTNIRDSVVTWGGVLNNRIVTSFSALQTWLQTHTDNIIDAIKGSGGGANIDSAQSDLDNQLTQIENVENQLSQSVLDKVEVPSLSLSADQSSGLRWVVTTINDIYVALPEFHVMFACVFFFGVVGVLVFGRRHL